MGGHHEINREEKTGIHRSQGCLGEQQTTARRKQGREKSVRRHAEKRLSRESAQQITSAVRPTGIGLQLFRQKRMTPERHSARESSAFLK